MLGKDRSPFTKIGPYMASFLVLGLAIPALLYVLVMGLLGWSTASSGAGASIFGTRDDTIYLYEAPSTVEHFARIGGNYENLLGSWRNYFADQKRPFKPLKGVADLGKVKAGVLILASAVSLSGAERLAIKNFRDSGGSVLATWATGTRDEKGEWVGWAFLEELGASEIEPLKDATTAKYLVVNGEMPVSHTHPAGQRIPMTKPAESLLNMKGKNTAARLLNAVRMNDQPNTGDAAVIYSEKSQKTSRAVVFAFSESAWETKPFATQVLIDDVMQWLTHEVSVSKAAWPKGMQSAQVIEMDVQEQPQNAQQFALDVRAADLPATFFVSSRVAKEDPRLFALISDDFEIAYHGDSLLGFRGVDANSQRRRLGTMVSELKSTLPSVRGLIGFRAPSEDYDGITQSALAQMDIRYHATGGNVSEARLPLFAKTSETSDQESLLLLPRTQRDDLELIGTKLSAPQVAQRMIDDLTESSKNGALGWLTIRSQSMKKESVFSEAFAQYLEHVKKIRRTVWFANAAQVHQWWRDRERIKFDSKFNGKRLDFNVTVTGDSPVKGASFVVMLPSKDSKPNVQAIKVGVPMPKVVLIDEFRAALVFDETKVGNYNYTVSFDAK